MPKKILIFSLAYHPFIGGAEVAIKETTDRIASDDFVFHMVTLRMKNDTPRQETIGNVIVHRIGPNKLFFPFSSCLKAWRLHRQYRYNGVWAMMANYAGFGALFFKLLHSRVPYLLTLQEGDPIGYIKHRVRFVYPLFVQIFRKADAVQVISNYLGQWARDMGYTGPIAVIPNAVDVALFAKRSPHVHKVDKKHGGVYLITVSRLVKKNAVDDIIRALSLLPAHIHLLVLGEGPDEEKLRTLVHESGLDERVHFLGRVPYESIPEYLHESDIFIRPSLSEGFGNAFVEAMAAGIPVIATQEGGIADFLFDPERNPDTPPTGRAVAPRDPEGIAGRVEAYLNDPDKTREIVENARAMVAEKYDWGIIAKDMKKVLDKLVKV